MKLGSTARDTITGFAGVLTSRHEYLNGCVRLTIQPTTLHDGKPIESQTFDIEQLELISEPKPRTTEPKGGPQNEPKRPAVPSR